MELRSTLMCAHSVSSPVRSREFDMSDVQAYPCTGSMEDPHMTVMMGCRACGIFFFARNILQKSPFFFSISLKYVSMKLIMVTFL
jgi:hypothetical protein